MFRWSLDLRLYSPPQAGPVYPPCRPGSTTGPANLQQQEFTMSKHGQRGLRRLLDASRYSLAGLGSAWRSEEAFRQEAVLLIVLVPLALWLGRGPLEWVLLIGCWLLVLIVELLNTAVEYTVDRIGPERHELSGRAKDIGSAAVMLSLVLAGVVWIGVVVERITG